VSTCNEDDPLSFEMSTGRRSPGFGTRLLSTGPISREVPWFRKHAHISVCARASGHYSRTIYGGILSRGKTSPGFDKAWVVVFIQNLLCARKSLRACVDLLDYALCLVRGSSCSPGDMGATKNLLRKHVVYS